MLTNHYTVALRHFWHNKLFTLIHIAGLFIGIRATIGIYPVKILRTE